MEICNSFREIDNKTKLMNMNVFQEKKDFLSFNIIKADFFESLLNLKRFSKEVSNLSEIQKILPELKKFSQSFLTIIKYNISNTRLYEEIKIKIIDKMIFQSVSQLFLIIENESSKVFCNNEKEFIPSSSLQMSIQLLIEYGILYHNLNYKFLYIDKLLHILVSNIYSRFLVNNEFRLNFNIYVEKVLSLFIYISNKDVKHYFKSNNNYFEIVNNKSNSRNFFLNCLLHVNAVMFKSVDKYVKSSNYFLDFINQEMKDMYAFNRKNVVESLMFYYDEIVYQSFTRFKEWKKAFKINKILNIEELTEIIEILIIKLKDFVSKTIYFTDKTTKLEDLIFMYTYLIFIIKKLGVILKYFKMSTKSVVIPQNHRIQLIMQKRDIKLNLTDFTMLYCQIIKKIRKILRLNIIILYNSLDETDKNFENLEKSNLNTYYDNLKNVLTTLSKNQRISKLMSKYNLIYNILCILIEEKVLGYYKFYYSLCKTIRNKLKKSFKNWLLFMENLVKSIENDFFIKIEKSDIPCLKDIFENQDICEFENMAEKFTMNSY